MFSIGLSLRKKKKASKAERKAIDCEKEQNHQVNEALGLNNHCYTFTTV
jgi:hypothetical protein